MKNQSEFLEINCNLLKAHQKLCVQHAIGFGFCWKIETTIFSQSSSNQQYCNHVISLCSHLETALKNKCKNLVIFCQGMVVQLHCSLDIWFQMIHWWDQRVYMWFEPRPYLVHMASLRCRRNVFVWEQATHGGCNKNLNTSTIDELVSWYHLKAWLSMEVIFRAEWGIHGDPNSRQVTLIKSFQSNNCQNWGVTEGKVFNRASKVAVR